MELDEAGFSVDLVEVALRHLDFLEEVSSIGTLLRDELLQHALRRYEQLWLPLATEYRHADIVPPVDISWMWYIHMLSPLAYRRDCRKLLGRTLDHTFKHPDDIIACANKTVEIWYERYPRSGYNIIRNGEYAERKQRYVTSDPSKLSVSLTANTVSHLQFFDQVSLPHFRDRRYLEGAVKRYKQFLILKRHAPDEFLTPCVDIILIWYTHMCYPIAYAKDLSNICGRIMDNNIKVKHALINQNYITARNKTNEMWSKVSREEFVQPGTKLRSSENKKEISPITLDDLKSSCVLEYELYLTHIELLGHPEKTHTKFDLKIYLVNSQNAWEELMTLKGNRRIWSVSAKFQFHTHKHKQLKFVLTRQSRMWCFKGFVSYANGLLDLNAHLQNMGSIDRSLQTEVTMETTVSDSLRVAIEGSVVNSHPILCQLLLVALPYEKQITESTLLSRNWGNYQLPDSTLKDKHEIYTAIHSFQNQEGVECFKCRLLHIPDLIRSGVEVYFHNKLVATSYVIGSPHLPTPNQVQRSDASVAFDPELGERAMLLRNHRGDWAICVARWVEESARSHLHVRIMKLGQRSTFQQVEIRSADVQFQSFNANLYTGSVQINPSKNTVAENLATLWSLCILYVLCAPKDGNRQIKLGEMGSEIPTEQDDEEGARRVPESECRFLVAAGLLTNTPSNEMISSTYGSLRHDILMDAKDVIITEQKLNSRLLKKKSKIRTGDLDGSPKRPKKKTSYRSPRRKSASIDSNEQKLSRDDPGSYLQSQNKIKLDEELGKKKDKTSNKQIKKHGKKHKKMHRKKRSSGLDDMLPVSDDSFTKEDVEELDKVLVTNEKGQKVLTKKASDYFDNAKALKQDVFDKEAKEDEEYHRILNVEKLKAVEEQPQDTLVMEIKEQTTIIKDIAEKKRDLASRQGKRNTDIFMTDGLAKPEI